jgi:hypothetical protein
MNLTPAAATLCSPDESGSMSFYFYDLETFGSDPRRRRIAQCHAVFDSGNLPAQHFGIQGHFTRSLLTKA